MASAPPQEDDSETETPPLWHPAYDFAGGLALLGIGVLSRLYHPEPLDTLDTFFDVLAVVWFSLGALRWGRRRSVPKRAAVGDPSG